MEKEFDFTNPNVNKKLLLPNVVQYDYNLFYEKKRMTTLEERIQSIIFLGIIFCMLLTLGYNTYSMYEENKNKTIIPATIEEGVIKLLPMNIEINRNRHT